VKLEQIDMIGPEPVQGSMELFPGGLIGHLIGFCGQEKVLPPVLHPGADSKLRIPVPGGCVDMIDSIRCNQIQHAIGFILVGSFETDGTEYHAAAHVAGFSETSFGNLVHWMLLS
jgi:hypothetical protein